MDEILDLDAVAQADLVRRREVTALELAEVAIARTERLNPQINAVIISLFDKARALATSSSLPRGSLSGVPFLLKDLSCTSNGDPQYDGMRLLRDLGRIATHDSYLAAKFKAAGLIVLGKTNTPELGLFPTTEPETFGATRNPWDSSCSAGGSSGGSAAAVAARLVAVAHGGDGGGSIRIPASECGLVGLKPSRARVSLGPAYGDGIGGRVCELAVTRSVRDPAAGDPYAAPTPVRPYATEVGADPGRLRIGLQTSAPGGGVEVHPDCIAAA